MKTNRADPDRQTGLQKVKSAVIWLLVGAVIAWAVPRWLDSWFPSLTPASSRLVLGEQRSKVAREEVEKLRLLRPVPSEIESVCLLMENTGSEPIDNVGLFFRTDRPIIAHEFPIGVNISRPSGEPVADLYMDFSYKELADLAIGSIPGQTQMVLTFYIEKNTNSRAFCVLCDSVVNPGPWPKDVKYEIPVLSFTSTEEK